ncbi:hypothetical protein SCLCIDRAFT_1218962 [Scleroderma citrinum Foug A]|uniref:Uncharacterized protein n=1 Tax=Scleroderma citrinum Foug A TaxID=1036808 RepID=A0A0C3DPS4_9AGAM|nr:hypothetical protein SCLCIDRAFT_1218962 [Scleroderma citrinum Foug A]
MHRLKIPRDAWNASQFMSLSPIYFASQRELSAKLTTYKQRPRNKNRREDENPQDNSSANRGYIMTGTKTIHYRAYFEQQRTLYHLLSRRIAPEKFALSSPPWLGAVRVISIVFVEWAVDKRPRAQRLDDPRLIEVGYTDALFPNFFDTLAGTTLHLKLKKKVMVKNPQSKDPHHSTTEEIGEDKLPERLRTVFNHDVHKSGVPLILLCHDEEMTLSILGRSGIDTSSFESGLDTLLPLSGFGPSSSRIQRRSRSRSPQRGSHRTDPRRDYSHPVKSEDGNIRSRTYHGPHSAAYVVDIQKLANALMQVTVPRTVPEIAALLRIQTDTRMCGGDDSLLQLRMWISMAESAAIDEQRSIRAARQAPCAELLPGPSKPKVDVNNDEDDLDPNDLDAGDPNDLPGAQLPTVARAIDDFSDDDF